MSVTPTQAQISVLVHWESMLDDMKGVDCKTECPLYVFCQHTPSLCGLIKLETGLVRKGWGLPT